MSSPSSSSAPILYPLDPSAVNVEEFVTVKLSEENYLTWRSMMLSLIQSYDLVRFALKVTAEVEKEIEEEKKLEDWKRTDELLRGWIRATINENLLVLLEHSETTREDFNTLEKRLTQPFQPGFNEVQNRVARDNSASTYLPIIKAAFNGDREDARRLLKTPGALRAVNGVTYETALMVAARSVQRINFLRKLVDVMTPVDLAMVDYNGRTSLHLAAMSGNVEAAKLLVKKNPQLPNIGDTFSEVPLVAAAICGKREMVLYLLPITKESSITINLFIQNGRLRKLPHALITSGFYDIALNVIQNFPELVHWNINSNPLRSIAGEPSAFLSGAHFNLWQRWIYSCIPVKMENLKKYDFIKGRDIESADDRSSLVNDRQMLNKLNGLLWKIIAITVPPIKQIRDKKLIHQQALELVKHLCTEIVQKEHSKVVEILAEPLFKAATVGIHEIVKEILDSFPSAVHLQNHHNQSVFQVAIVNRREMVFNIIYQFEGASSSFLAIPDGLGNVGLHLAGYFGPEQSQGLKANAAGPVLQIQREMQWFKPSDADCTYSSSLVHFHTGYQASVGKNQEVRKLSLTIDKQKVNNDRLTPVELFNQKHRDLMKEGEQWLKNTAGSCTIIGALIVTVVFAAAITVPGGTKSDTGLPFFSTRKAFIVFAISDVLALFSSASSLLLFLSILTSYYSEQDFLSALPRRLITGYVTLFLSILFMMIAFGATIQLLFGSKNPWVFIPLVGLASTPVILFVFLQFPMLIDIIKCTYGSGNFRKISGRPFY
ncbi:hypothetical protein LguiB_021624 [Lonicera macranthoides]